MKETVVKKVELENKQTIVIYDASRKISEDAYVVKMKAEMEVLVEKNLFSDKEIKELFFEDIIDKLGSVVKYEYLSERNFIMAKDKDELFETLVQDFFTNLGQYISKSNFPKKLILKQYKDMVNNKTKTIKVV
ncbi:MAG: hypothetical protein KAR45_12950 [Desulfobacteraceae bacterium]|nr:hypothetical protein [Desulfobacteraceae bacterium]